MSTINIRQQFENWAATQDMDLKPGRCTMGEFQHADCDADFAWEAWKFQEARLAELRKDLDEAQSILRAVDASLKRGGDNAEAAQLVSAYFGRRTSVGQD